MQESLDYRGLRRWSMLILFPVLLLSSWMAALLMLFVSLPFTLPAFSAVAIAGVGIVGVAALIIPPVIGTLAGLWGIAFGKGQVIRAFGATRVPSDHPLVQVTHRMAARLGMPGPEVYVYPDDDVNAWATGQSASTAAIGLTRGALQRLTKDQVEAVIGHELGHIAAADTRRLHFARSFQNALVWFFGFRSWRWKAQHIFGFVGQMGIMGMSRRREYWADAVGAALTSPQTMQETLRAVAKGAQRPPRERKYYNQLMFNWPGSVFLSSHPTLQQRLAALDDGEFYGSVLRKMGASSSRRPKPLQNRSRAAETDWRRTLRSLEERFDNPWVEGTVAVGLAIVAISTVWYAFQAAHAPSHAIVVEAPAPVDEPVIASQSEPAAPIVRAEKVLPPVVGPRVAAWSAEVKSPPPPISASDADEYAVPGFGCFKRMAKRVPPGIEHVFDDQKEWSVYRATSAQGEQALGTFTSNMRQCLTFAGGTRKSSSDKVDKRPIEVWAFANETTCWFTPEPTRRGSEALNVIGRCHSPED